MLVPSARFGAVLRDVRGVLELDLDEMASRSGGRFDSSALAAYEAGLPSADEGTVEALARLYGVETRLLSPPRGELVIDLVRGEVLSGEHHVPIPTDADEPSVVLSRYLELVYAMRGLAPGEQFPLRGPDLQVLGEALELGVVDVEAELRELMSSSGSELETRGRRLRRRLIVPAAGILVAATAVGTLLLVRDTSTDVAPGTSADTDPVGSPTGAPAATADPDLFGPVPVDPGETSVELPPIVYERDDPSDPPGDPEVITE
jgi:transcriptional regulator with XRE-family HTH domain